VNRRTFLLAIGATACSGPTSQRPKPPPPRPPPDAADHPATTGDVWAPPAWQGRASPLAVFDERLAQRTETELRFWDLRTMQRTHTLATAYRDACFLPDGRLAALAESKGPYPELHLIDAQGAVDVRTGTNITNDARTRVFAAESADAIYVSELDELVERCDLSAKHFRVAGQITIPDRDLVVSLGDGSLVAPTRESLRIFAPGKPMVALKTPARPVLVAATAGARAWVALMPKDASGAQVLVLARLTDTLVTAARIDVSPGRVFDLATADNAAAALIDTAGKTEYTRSVAVFEQSGKERWRADAPMHARAFVAMSKQRVVMMRNDGTLMAWDAATGAPITTA
jgi:hypothetical protein